MIFIMEKVLLWLPSVFFGLILVSAALIYRKAFSQSEAGPAEKRIKVVLYVAVGFEIFYAIVLSASQYYVWSTSEFTRLLLPPTASIKYFIQYSFTHFWLGTFCSFFLSLLFYSLLSALKKKNENFFLPGETQLGFLCALVSGWPDFVLYLPLLLISTVIVSLARRLIAHEERTTLGWPMILAAVVTLLAGNYLIDLLGLGVLRI
jgi:hypothetical protein